MAETNEPQHPDPAVPNDAATSGQGADPFIFDTIADNLNLMAEEAREYGKAVREWLRANALAASTHNQEEVDRLRRMAAAKAVGLDPVHFDIPFPGAIVNKTEHYHPPGAMPSPPSNGGFSLLGKLLLGGALALGAGGLGVGGFVLGQLLNKPAAPVQKPEDIATQIYEKGPDGNWKKVTP